MSDNFRETRLAIDLGGEQVEFVSLTAHESLSEPFQIELQITAPLGELDLAPHIGEPVGVTVFEDEEEVRYFNGILVEAVYLRETSDGFYYNLSLRSFMHFMDSRKGFAIFQEKTAIDILKDVFAAAGISDYDLRISESYEPFEYCVQYGESDFNFISRIMEQEGLYYFFEHTEDKHTLVICDKASNHRETKVGGLAFNPTAEASQSYRVSGAWGEKHYLKSWTERVSSSAHDRVTLRDFDFKKPTKPVEGEATGEKEHPKDEIELYDYPGPFIEPGRGSRLSKARLDQLRAQRRSYSTEATAKGLTVGTTFKLSNHPNDRFNAEYMIVSTLHQLQSQSYRSGTGQRDEDQVHLVAIPASTQFRAPLKTPKPRVVGLESAIVTGPSGETIFTDEFGRVKVRFHWDRTGTPDEKSTCWIRVSQTGGLGNVILPRVGHEVLVDFLHGDPDRPVVTGRVFNKEHMPVYPLPANKTIALWRTLTYGKQDSYPETEKLDTGEPKANELRFEDKGGKEEVFLHAERDMNVRVRFDTSKHVGHDEQLKVGRNRERYVKKDEKVTIDGNRTYVLKLNEKNTITQGNRTTEIKQGNDELTIKQGNLTIKTSLGKVLIEAMQSIELKVGGTSLKLTPANATLTSPMIKVDGKAMTEVKAGGILTEQAALIKIN
ncbi:Phage-related baseplate assembly protein [Tsuneonella dongtanensis]|uniref:Phage-related baseplate assembly protein n=1 Tax=Tsuneonella dongtanensis TaxID=692370 RepID=A0A1B2ABA8_9SPHN|nr:type VI secretion system tip protein TssI/VgrG [Tsuneonella dongtanensis]ANY19394.1 Phage-related baseplate assembly protein [Tsuneonella dongtanensis]